MRIDLTGAKNLKLFIDNISIDGNITEIDSNGRIFFEITSATSNIPMEMGKHVTLSMEKNGRKFYVAGKMFFQPPSKILIKPDTGIENEHREAVRKETPALPANVICKHRFFHHEQVRVVINNLSIKGARIDTQKPLKEKIVYSIETSFPYHHQQLSFSATFHIKNCRVIHNNFSYGISFIDIDVISENNLKKYLFGEKIRHSF